MSMKVLSSDDDATLVTTSHLPLHFYGPHQFLLANVIILSPMANCLLVYEIYVIAA